MLGDVIDSKRFTATGQNTIERLCKPLVGSSNLSPGTILRHRQIMVRAQQSERVRRLGVPMNGSAGKQQGM
jgi:hypothetical protein